MGRKIIVYTAKWMLKWSWSSPFPKFFSLTEKSDLLYKCQFAGPLCLVYFTSLTEGCQQNVSNLQILKSGLSWRSWSWRKENSKRHPWMYESNIGWQVSGIHICEELVCQLLARKFWDQDAAESERPSLVPTPQIVDLNFGQSTSLSQKNCWGTRNIHKTHWVYNSEYLLMQMLPAKPLLKFVKGNQKNVFSVIKQ